MSAISDLYAVILPCIMTRHLRLPGQQRLALYAIFCLGLLAVAASGVRTYWMVSALVQSLKYQLTLH